MDRVMLPGAQHNANVSLKLSAPGLACTAEVFLSADGGATKVATSGQVAFTATGSQQTVICPVTMPQVGGIFYAYLDIAGGGVVLDQFADEANRILVPVVSNVEITW